MTNLCILSFYDVLYSAIQIKHYVTITWPLVSMSNHMISGSLFYVVLARKLIRIQPGSDISLGFIKFTPPLDLNKVWNPRAPHSGSNWNVSHVLLTQAQTEMYPSWFPLVIIWNSIPKFQKLKILIVIDKIVRSIIISFTTSHHTWRLVTMA